jgi:hypothetical protein
LLCTIDAMNFQPYLDTIVNSQRDQTCRDWQDFYTPTEAELPLKVQTRSLSEVEEQGRSLSSQAKKSEQMEVLSGLRKYASQHVLLVGKPGSGKSTALKRLLWEEAKYYLAIRSQKSQEELYIPVLIKLRECRNCSILDLIQKSLRKLRLNRAEIEELLLDQQLLLLFDGLNEMPSNDVGQEVESFRSDFSDTPMIFTTRDLGVEISLGIQTKLEMMPLTEPQMHHFIEKRLPGQANVLLEQMRDRLRELAETPLLLQMLCDVFSENKQGIPQNRGELFRKEFARRYAEFKPARTLPISENSRRFTSELLQYLAFVMVQGNPHTDPCKPTPPCLTYVKTEAEKILESFLIGRVTAPAEAAKEWLEDLLEHNLLQLANEPDEIEFHHQLFQEYYAAEYLLQQLPTLIQKQPGEEYSPLQREYLNYLKWTEAIALMMGLLNDETQAIQIVEQALEVDLTLGARLAGEVKPNFQEQTVHLVNLLDVPEWFKIELLGITNSNYAIRNLLNFAFHSTEFCSAAIYSIGINKASETIPTLLELLKNTSVAIREAAAEALECKCLNNEVPTLLGYISDPSSKVRRSITTALGQTKSRDVLPFLIEATTDTNFHVRFAAVSYLKEICTQEELEILLVDIKKFEAVLAAELFEIARKSFYELNIFQRISNSPENEIPNLMKLDSKKFKSSDVVIRRQIVKELVKDSSNINVFRLMEAIQDEDAEVRWLVAQALEKVPNQLAIKYLPYLRSLLSTKSTWELYRVHSHVQSQCKFYNYDIAQSLLAPVVQSSNPFQNPSLKAHYEDILKIIFHIGQEIQRKPATYRGMGEEALRDIFLAALNAKYQGCVTGETFNKAGKTDILIRIGDRNTFIAECKIWDGAELLKKTLDQLLGYATWQDTQLAILLFNRNKNLSAVLNQIPAVLKEHTNVIRQIPSSADETGFQFMLHHSDDPEREMVLTVLVFEIPK